MQLVGRSGRGFVFHANLMTGSFGRYTSRPVTHCFDSTSAASCRCQESINASPSRHRTFFGLNRLRAQPLSPRPVPSSPFTLMADRQNQDGLLILLKAIQGRVTGTSAGYHQFSQSMLDGTTNQRMTAQQLHGFLNQLKRSGCRRRINVGEEVGQPFEIGKRSCRIAQLCQDRALGFAGLLPAMRALKYA